MLKRRVRADAPGRSHIAQNVILEDGPPLLVVCLLIDVFDVLRTLLFLTIGLAVVGISLGLLGRLFSIRYFVNHEFLIV